MAEQLLTSEKFVKNVTNISDNLAGKYLLSAMREAQDMGLKTILGDSLFEKLKALVAAREIGTEGNEKYQELLDKAQYYLAYLSVVEVTNKVSYKIGNFGVAKSSDENLQVASYDEITKMQFYYQSKVDFYCDTLQRWLLDNRASFPELTENTCSRIKANLHSAASCGIFLGGPRGKCRGGRRR